MIHVKSWALEASVLWAFRVSDVDPKGRGTDWATRHEALCFSKKSIGDSGMFITETFWHKILSCTCEGPLLT